jgi:hypothetical protein
MSRDWKAAAAAFAPDVPQEQLEKIIPALEALDAAFQPQLANLPPETEPACVLLVAREKEEAQ